MAHGTRLSAAVMFVHQLDRSVAFYTAVLALTVTDASPTAALLTSQDGSQLILRAMGGGAAHAMGSVGVQYVVWTAAQEAELDRCEQELRSRSAHVGTRRIDGVSAVEGRDPDGLPVIISHSGPEHAPMRELPIRIYGW
jgi:catechol-2,3-dioxygenase